jgi:thiamine biosynthesis lipoprotein ApbE
MANTDILFSREGALGQITLNRPKALNALTHGMCASILGQLHEWGREPGLKAVLIDAEHDPFPPTGLADLLRLQRCQVELRTVTLEERIRRAGKHKPWRIGSERPRDATWSQSSSRA